MTFLCWYSDTDFVIASNKQRNVLLNITYHVWIIEKCSNTSGAINFELLKSIFSYNRLIDVNCKIPSIAEFSKKVVIFPWLKIVVISIKSAILFATYLAHLRFQGTYLNPWPAFLFFVLPLFEINRIQHRWLISIEYIEFSLFPLIKSDINGIYFDVNSPENQCKCQYISYTIVWIHRRILFLCTQRTQRTQYAYIKYYINLNIVRTHW